ncbi:unnamed protein product, partial [Ectocarpus fasciculatus]
TLSLFFVLCVAGGYLVGSRGAEDAGLSWGSFVLGAVSVLVMVALAQRDLQHALTPSEKGSFLGAQSFDFDDDGVHLSCEHCEGFTRWAGVLALRETTTHFFVMTDRIGGYMIPKRDVGGDEACENLRVRVTSQVERAHPHA